mgnify:CR=1 FL=1
MFNSQAMEYYPTLTGNLDVDKNVYTAELDLVIGDNDRDISIYDSLIIKLEWLEHPENLDDAIVPGVYSYGSISSFSYDPESVASGPFPSQLPMTDAVYKEFITIDNGKLLVTSDRSFKATIMLQQQMSSGSTARGNFFRTVVTYIGKPKPQLTLSSTDITTQQFNLPIIDENKNSTLILNQWNTNDNEGANQGLFTYTTKKKVSFNIDVENALTITNSNVDEDLDLSKIEVTVDSPYGVGTPVVVTDVVSDYKKNSDTSYTVELDLEPLLKEAADSKVEEFETLVENESTFVEDNNMSLKFSRYANYSSSENIACLLYTSPSPRDLSTSRMPSSA